MVPVWLQLDLLVSLAVASAGSHSHHFSHETKATTKNKANNNLSLFRL